jgi:hypothetical protein
MSFAECFIAVQINGNVTKNPPAAEYFVLALVAIVLGLVILILIRTNARRLLKR